MKSLDYGNRLREFNAFTLDYELNALGAYDGATSVINRTHTRSDNLNLTGISASTAPPFGPYGLPRGSAISKWW